MKIHNKLFLTLFSFSLLLIAGLVLLIQWSIGKGMVDYVNNKEVEILKPVIAQLAREYQYQDSWQTMLGADKKLAEMLLVTLKDPVFIPAPPSKHNIPPHMDHKAPPNSLGTPTLQHQPPMIRFGYALLDETQKQVAGHYDRFSEHSKTAITVNQITVGWLVIPKRDEIAEGYELDFIKQQQSSAWIIALVMMLFVVLITVPLARHLVRPIKQLISGMNRLTQGDYLHQLALQRKDEFAELERDFNELALTLHENERARKRWLANIAHELRTPVTILRGELEAMLDDVRPLNKSNIDSANDEVKHLQHLIKDLHQLTSADIGGMHYRKKSEDLTRWLSLEVTKYSDYLKDADIKLAVEIEDKPANVFADRTRLCQLFDNLFNNCIKYAQADLVRISVQSDERATQPVVMIKVEDNGNGVADEHLPHLFEHLYRVDSSRNRKTGGSGLGLSICAHIVSAHQGEISALQSELGGLAIIIALPLTNNGIEHEKFNIDC